MDNNRFLKTSDYYEIITKEALAQIIKPGNEYKFKQAEDSAEMSILENLIENYEIERELVIGKSIRKYDRKINYPIGAYVEFNDEIYKVIRSISGYKMPSNKEYWVECIPDVSEEIPRYSQFYTYRTGDRVMFNNIAYECLNDNGYDLGEVRIPQSKCWEVLKVSEWTPVKHNLNTVMSYKGKFYQLYDDAVYNEITEPDKLPQCWGLVLDYDPEHNNYILSQNECVVYEGEVYYPIVNVNSDSPVVGFNMIQEDPRHKNVKKHMVRLALYELTKNISPNNVSVTRQNDYEMSLQWLHDANRLKINPMIQRKVDDFGKPAVDWGIATFQKEYNPYQNPWQV